MLNSEIIKDNSLSILIVEDDAPARILMSTILRKFSDNIYIAENGNEGLKTYHSKKPSLIISDIGMAGMNGLEMAYEIRQIDKKTPIVFTTAFDQKDTLLQAIELGVSNYIVKPVSKDVVVSTISKLIEILKLEQSLSREQESVRTLTLAIEYSSSMVVILNNQFEIDFVNKKVLQKFNCDKSDLIGITPKAFFDSSNVISTNEIKNRLNSSNEWFGELKLKTSHNDLFWASVSLSRLLDESGLATHYVAVVDDITHKKLQEEELLKSHSFLEQMVAERTKELEKAKEKAEAASKAKSLFLAKVSHELRTPMNGIIGMSSILLDTELNDKQRKNVNIMHFSAKSLLTIINDILDYTKIESGKMMLHHSEFSFVELMEQVEEFFTKQAEDKGLTFNVNLHNISDYILIGDEDRIRQILINLIGNAIKFTEKGFVEASIKAINLEGENIQINIIVRDSGIGIAEGDQQFLFKSFSQVDNSLSRKHGGTGLGLVITKELVEMMDGAISLESKANIGSEFIVSLPLKISKNKQFAKPEKNKAEILHKSENGLIEIAKQYPDFGFNILVAEDSLINAELIKQALVLKNCSFRVVANGKEALAALKEDYYDLILMDVNMPELDGIEATKIIRNNEAQSPNKIPIIGLSGDAAENDIWKCLDAGMDAYIVKPINWDEFYEKLHHIWQEYTSIISEKPLPLNLNKLYKSVNKKKTVLQLIIDYFMENAPKEINKLNEAILKSNYKQVHFIAHKMKSEIVNLGADNTTFLLQSLEDEAKNENNKNLLTIFENIRNDINSIIDYFKSNTIDQIISQIKED